MGKVPERPHIQGNVPCAKSIRKRHWVPCDVMHITQISHYGIVLAKSATTTVTHPTNKPTTSLDIGLKHLLRSHVTRRLPAKIKRFSGHWRKHAQLARHFPGTSSQVGCQHLRRAMRNYTAGTQGISDSGAVALRSSRAVGMHMANSKNGLVSTQRITTKSAGRLPRVPDPPAPGPLKQPKGALAQSPEIRGSIASSPSSLALRIAGEKISYDSRRRCMSCFTC